MHYLMKNKKKIKRIKLNFADLSQYKIDIIIKIIMLNQI